MPQLFSWAQFQPKITDYYMPRKRTEAAEKLLVDLSKINPANPQPGVSNLCQFCYKEQISPNMNHPRGLGNITALPLVQLILAAKGFASLESMISMRDLPGKKIAQEIENFHHSKDFKLEQQKQLDFTNAEKAASTQAVSLLTKVGQTQYELLQWDENTHSYSALTASLHDISKELHISKPMPRALMAASSDARDQMLMLPAAFDTAILDHYKNQASEHPKYRLFQLNDLYALAQLPATTSQGTAVTAGEFKQYSYDPTQNKASLSVRNLTPGKYEFVEVDINRSTLNSIRKRTDRIGFMNRMSDGGFNIEAKMDHVNAQQLLLES